MVGRWVSLLNCTLYIVTWMWLLVICSYLQNFLLCAALHQSSTLYIKGHFTLLPSCGITKKYFYSDCFSLLCSFTDFAVGAPYHSTGRVSIWMGSKTGISQTPSQVRLREY